MKGLDHIVWCVDDLDEASSVFGELGFTVTPRARHPFGTHNCLVQLDGFFLELLCVVEPEKITPAEPGNFSFAHFNQEFLRQRQGISMLVLDSDDFQKDYGRTQSQGLETYRPFEFSRKAKLPDGRQREVSFGLNFNTSCDMPDLAFFTCQQFQPQYFWNKDYQRHANSAVSVNEVALVAPEPRRHEVFLQSFSNCQVTKSSDNEVRIATGRGDIAVYSKAGYEMQFAEQAPGNGDAARFAAIVLGVKDLSMIKKTTVHSFGADIHFESVTG